MFLNANGPTVRKKKLLCIDVGMEVRPTKDFDAQQHQKIKVSFKAANYFDGLVLFKAANYFHFFFYATLFLHLSFIFIPYVEDFNFCWACCFLHSSNHGLFVCVGKLNS